MFGTLFRATITRTVVHQTSVNPMSLVLPLVGQSFGINSLINVLSCLIFEHDPLWTALAVSILFVGSVLTMRLFARVRRTKRSLKSLWLCLAGVIGGGTIWSTHFLAMLAYESPLILGYDPLLTTLSLVSAIITTTIGLLISAATVRSWFIEAGGAVMGFGVATMHYIGMSAMVVSGTVAWNWNYLTASIFLGAVFSGLAMSRIARPVTRFCKYGASTAFCIAVGSMHFTGMTALTIVPQNMEFGSIPLITGQYLGIGVVFVTAVILAIASISYSIDLKTAEQRTKEHIHLSMHDPLTTLLNRLGCETKLSELVENREDDTARVVVIVADLNRFREINDRHGQVAGDHLLRSIGKSMVEEFGTNAIVGRIGGNEFLVAKSGIHSMLAAKKFALKVQDLLSDRVDWKDVQLSFDASVGYALFPDDGENPSNLMERAELAMYRAKSQGRNPDVVAYDSDLDEAVREKSTLASELVSGIANGEFEVHFQLQNNTDTGDITGVEALVRWHHPVRGQISPGKFIPIAEEYGSIVELGNWVLMESCRQAVGWSVPLKVAVNVSSMQLADPLFPGVVKSALETTGLQSKRLELEITESGIIADMNHALQTINQLKSLGLRIAMDDYGTGYSSLATLQNFPFDKIKIDQQFIKDVTTREQSAAIVQSTIILGNSLNIPVLAEGVETEDHLEFLKEVGCLEVQGFLFGKPMPGKDLGILLKSIKPEFETQLAY